MLVRKIPLKQAKKTLLVLGGIAAAILAIKSVVMPFWPSDPQPAEVIVVLGRFPILPVLDDGRGQISLKFFAAPTEDQPQLCGDYAVITIKNIGPISLDKIGIQFPGSGIIQRDNKLIAVNKHNNYGIEDLGVAQTINMTIWYSALEQDKASNIFVSHFINGGKRALEVNLAESNFSLTRQPYQVTWKVGLLFGLVLLVLVLIYNSVWGEWLRNKIGSLKVPKFASYRSDSFFGYQWRWDCDQNYVIKEPIFCYCPKCDYQILPRPSNQGGFVFVCDECGFLNKRGKVSFMGELEQKVILKVQQKIRLKDKPSP